MRRPAPASARAVASASNSLAGRLVSAPGWAAARRAARRAAALRGSWPSCVRGCEGRRGVEGARG
eukprot:4699053-Prymnesium_polylepis.1